MTIGLGCMRLSTDRARDPERSHAVIAAAVDAGIALLDTADAYALDDTEAGHNEALIARALAEIPGHRVEIATKGGLVRPGGAWQPDGRARHLAAAARHSRARLGVAAIDLYLLHAVDPKTPLATSVRALARLRDDGVVRRIGLSNIGLTQLEAALAIAPIDAVEVELSPWKLDAIRGGLVAACAARGIRLLAYRPLGGPAGVRRAAADPVLAALAARIDATPVELVLAWLTTLAPVIVPLPGATQVATARSAARAGALVLDDDARAALAGRFLTVTGPPSVVAMRVPEPAPPAPPTPPSPPAPPSGAVPVPPPDGAPDAARASDTAGSPAAPEIVMVIGMPASGKSTLAAAYVAQGYLRLNRDELGGSLLALARRVDRALAGGARRIVVDNTYPTRASRAPVLEVARRHGAAVRCVAMATSLEQAQGNAVARILARHGRLLMPGGPAGEPNELARAGEIDPRALFRFRRAYEPPRDDEGFAAIEHAPRSPAAQPGGRAALIVELDDVVWRGRPRTPEAIELVPGARDALAAWSLRHLLAGTTWQPGLASVAALGSRLVELIGIPMEVVHCPHPAGPPVCWCRKPMPGLALALAHARGLDLARSLHAGKGPADRGFAARAGIRYLDVAMGWPPPEAR